MLRLHRSICLAVVLVPASAAAQAPPLPTPGQPVRIAHHCNVDHGRLVDCRHDRSPRVVEGRLRAVDGDTVRVRTSDGVLAIPAAFVGRTWVVDGTKGSFWAGAGIGLVLGAAVGAAVGSRLEICGLTTCSPATGYGVMVGLPAGFLIGGVIGAAVKSDGWREVGLSSPGVSLVPRPDGIGASVSIGF